jgi:hypothetical protein
MKNPTHYFTVAVLVAIAVLGCVMPRPASTGATKTAPDDLKARIDAAVKDRSNWVDPGYHPF